jgi:hypothetical protein
MKIVIVSNGVPERLKTSQLLNGIPHMVCFDTQKKADLCKGIIGQKGRIIVCNTRTLVGMRNFVIDKLIPRNKWFIGMDDNISAFTAVSKSFRGKPRLPTTTDKSRNWRYVYNKLCNPKEYIDLIKEGAYEADLIGSPLFGVATMENPFFRLGRYSYRRFVKTKMFAMLNARDLNFKYEQCHDSYLSALAVAKYGTVLVDNFMHYKSKMYEAGGLGDLERRKERGLEDQLEEIINQFPGLVSRGVGPNTALRFMLRSDSSVDKWRKENGYL